MRHLRLRRDWQNLVFRRTISDLDGTKRTIEFPRGEIVSVDDVVFAALARDVGAALEEMVEETQPPAGNADAPAVSEAGGENAPAANKPRARARPPRAE